MRTLPYGLSGRPLRVSDVAYLAADETPLEGLVDAIIQTISTDVEVRLGDVTVHLAMLLNPDHWETDWAERGIEDADAFIDGLVVA